MDKFEKAVTTVAENWEVILGSLPLFLILLGLAAWVAYIIARDRYKTQIDNAKSAVDSADRHRTFVEAQNKSLTEESDKLARRVAELEQKSSLTPADRLKYTSTSVLNSALEIVKTETHSIKFYQPFEQLPDKELALYAALTRMHELGAAKIDKTPPTTTTVTATVSMADLEQVLRWAKGRR